MPWDLIQRSPSSSIVINYSPFFFRSHEESGKDTLILQYCKHWGTSADPKRALSLWATYRSHPFEMDDEQLAIAPSKNMWGCHAGKTENTSQEALQGRNTQTRGWKKGWELYKMCPNQGSQCNCNHVGKRTLLLLKLHQENTISTVFCWTCFTLHWAREYSECQWDQGEDEYGPPMPPSQTTLGAPLCSKGSFSHWITG